MVFCNMPKDRQLWVDILTKTARPVLENLSRNTLHENMPLAFRSKVDSARLRKVMRLECFGRVMYGICPWLELGNDGSSEGRQRAEFAAMAIKALQNGVNPSAPDYMNFREEHQPLVDAAMLVHGLLKAPTQIWDKLDTLTQHRLINELKECVKITPYYNNWLLFPAEIECFILQKTGRCDMEPIKLAIKQHQEWYKGDGWYGDGKDLHFDYYNSFIIHPMLYDILTVLHQFNRDEEIAGKGFLDEETKRYSHYAGQLERLISPEGTYPCFGRSMVYRCGAMNALSQVALMKKLPAGTTPGQVRAALTKVITRQLGEKGTFGTYRQITGRDPSTSTAGKDLWLRFGFCGYQPEIAEGYVSTASMYFCLSAFAPLGLPADDEFWTAPAAKWTGAKAWNGEMIPKDESLTHN